LFQKILRPFKYILKAASKGIRTKMIKAFNYWLNVPADKFAVLQEVFEIYYIGALL